ncbi:MAG: ABC transporter substrate-binding protein, partial [Candidatus Nanopelagicales bacterium]
MKFKFATGTVALGTAAALALATAVPAQAAEPGVTSNRIVIGTTTALTGPAAPGYKDVPAAAQAYFDYVNANGGINGRKIDLRVFD